MTTPTPTDRLRAGFAKAVPMMERRRRDDLAGQYKPNDQMERIAGLSARAREAYFAASPTARIGYGLYADQKAAYEAEQERTR